MSFIFYFKEEEEEKKDYLKSCSLPKPLSLSNFSLFGAQETWRARKKKSETGGCRRLCALPDV